MKKQTAVFSTIKQYIPLSIVVLFVALTLCLGIALGSGAPLFSGLIAGIIGGVIHIILGLIRAGIIGYYFPLSAMNGILAGISIIIFIKQL